MGKITIVKKIAFVAMLFAMFGHLKAQCTFTGLNPQYCVTSATSALTTGTTGGAFSGPGVIGSVFSPSIAGPGTHTINYAICAAGYAVSSGVFAPTSTVGTALNLGDDALSGSLPIGFSFQFFCSNYTTFYISSNGFLTFNSASGNACCQGKVMPTNNSTPDNMIAYAWVDLNQTYGGSLTYTTVGTAPFRKLVVSLTNMMHHNVGEGGYPVTVQTILYESTNVIEIHATSIPIPINSASTTYSTTMGIQNSGGTSAFTVPGRNGTSTWSATNDMYKFTPSTGCISSQTTVVSPTLIPVSGSNTICSGSSAILTASGSTTYTWSTNSNAPTVTLSPTSSTAYSVSGTDAFGCLATRVLTVTLNSSPSIAVTSNTLSTCAGNTVNLTATGLNTYTWTGGISNGVTFTTNATTAYSVTGTNACGTASAAVTVTIVPLPVTASATSTLICSGTPATLTAGGATTYTWLPGNVTQTAYIISPTAAVVYTLSGASGVCRGSATLAIATKTNPVIAINTSTTTVCEGSPANLTASGALSYTWNPGFIIGSSIAVTPTMATLYTVTGPNAQNCFASASQVILVSPKPPIVAATSASAICPGMSTTLTATGANAYLWDNNSAGTSVIVVNPVTTITYSVTGTTTAGCANGATVTVNVFDPVLTVSSSTAICKGNSVNLSASGTDAFLWSTGSGFSSIIVTPTVTTTYTVLGSSTQGAISCSVNGAVTVSVNPTPTIMATATPSNICRGEKAVLEASGATSYTWAAETPSSSESLTVTPLADQAYTVTGDNNNGCRGTRTVLLRVSACVGIPANVLNTAKLFVYPNPSAGDFTISADQAIDLDITNELGQLVKTISLNNNNTKVNISGLNSGIYFITGKNANSDVKQKIIITK